MKTIFHLTEAVISKIAAGEVIERPAYVVKELIENAIDASATDIRIFYSDKDKLQIIISDNGTGMSKDDIQESYKLHTTSKIPQNTNVFHITTLGFRGEALASIAAVSNLTIQSRQIHQSHGNKIKINHGVAFPIDSIGMPKGTIVMVDELFENLPVRKHYNRNKQAEYKKIVDTILNYVLTYPSISFDFSHNGTLIFTYPRCKDTQERLKYIVGEEVFSHLIHLSIIEPYFSVEGFISTPQLNNTIKTYQHIFVNGRPVAQTTISTAIKDGYGILLSQLQNPTFYLYFTCNPEILDVNIHPRKETIYIQNIDKLTETLKKEIEHILQSSPVYFQGLPLSIKDDTNKLTYTTLAKQLKKRVLPTKEEQLTNSISSVHQAVQLHNLYILVQTTQGIAIIDQHAAHERILYESYLLAYLEQNEKHETYHLPEPINIPLTPQDITLMNHYLHDFQKIGFEIEIHNIRTLLITSIPSIFKDRNVLLLIKDFVQSFEQEQYSHTIDSGTKKLLAYLACRSAVKAGDPLTPDQMQMIIRELASIPSAITCPHGRPVQYLIDLNDLHKMFRR